MTDLTSVNSGGSFTLGKDRPPKQWLNIIRLCALFLACALVWAAWAEVDELSRAEGRIIPSSKTQTIQATESGVVAEILVRAGQQVKVGQQLIRLDDTTTSSSAGEVEARVRALTAQIARLRIELDGSADGYVCPPEIATQAPEVCENEADLLRARFNTLEQSKQVLAQRVEQRQRELNESVANQARLTQGLSLAEKKLGLLEPLVVKNLVSQTDYLSAQSEQNELFGQLMVAGQSIARLEAALSEAQLQVSQAELQFRETALTDLTAKLAELSSSREALRGAADRVDRTEIRSPVDGIVNNLEVNTIGSFVNAGELLLDIVPVGDTLLVEARLKPSDVAFVLPGQQATVKLTAYDFSVYGGVRGEVQNVSADSIIDPETRETYYLVLLSTESSVLTFNDEELPILPGMVTTVEILTGKKTVLNYLLKPINKARDEALRER